MYCVSSKSITVLSFKFFFICYVYPMNCCWWINIKNCRLDTNIAGAVYVLFTLNLSLKALYSPLILFTLQFIRLTYMCVVLYCSRAFCNILSRSVKNSKSKYYSVAQAWSYFLFYLDRRALHFFITTPYDNWVFDHIFLNNFLQRYGVDLIATPRRVQRGVSLVLTLLNLLE